MEGIEEEGKGGRVEGGGGEEEIGEGKKRRRGCLKKRTEEAEV